MPNNITFQRLKSNDEKRLTCTPTDINFLHLSIIVIPHTSHSVSA